RHHLLDQLREPLVIIASEPQLNLDVAPFQPSELFERLPESCNPPVDGRIGFHVAHQHSDAPRSLRRLLRTRRERPRRRRAAEQRDELATLHVWMAPAWQEIIWRAAQRSLAVMCPACSRSPDGLLALMESANRGLITRAGSMSQ